jgi:hypothetical protein
MVQTAYHVVVQTAYHKQHITRKQFTLTYTHTHTQKQHQRQFCSRAHH